MPYEGSVDSSQAGEWAWRLPFLLQLIPGLILGAGILFLPFSPRWLVSKGRDQEALSSLSRLRQLPSSDARVQQEWFDIRAEVVFHKEVSAARHPTLQDRSTISRVKLEFASWTDCFKRGCWRRTHIGIGLMFFQQFVGINALIYVGLSALIDSTRNSVAMPSDILSAFSIEAFLQSLTGVVFAYSLRNHGSEPQHAADHVRRSQHHSACRCQHEHLDDG